MAAERFRESAAVLSDAPSFSATDIAPGAPLTLAVPVNEFTQKVRVDVRSIDDPSVAINVPDRETAGDETVLFPLADTNLPPGVYLLQSLFLTSDGTPDPSGDSGYQARNPDERYILYANLLGVQSKQCLTDIRAASFTVVGE
ncbi:MAG: hypothetical protein WBN30_18330 [Polyangiales bacterium]